MKNIIKLLGIITIAVIIGFSIAACGDEEDGSGALTIIGLEDYNGNFAFAITGDEDLNLVAATGIDVKNKTMTGGKIGGGSVTLKVWEVVSENSFISYSGNDTTTFNVLIQSKALFSGDADSVVEYGIVTVKFKNGIASGVYTAIPLDEGEQKTIQVTGIPSTYNGNYGYVGLGLDSKLIALSLPVAISGGSFTGALLDAKSTSGNLIPWCDEGTFTVVLIISTDYAGQNDVYNGSITSKYIEDEITIIPFSSFIRTKSILTNTIIDNLKSFI